MFLNGVRNIVQLVGCLLDTYSTRVQSLVLYVGSSSIPEVEAGRSRSVLATYQTEAKVDYISPCLKRKCFKM